MKAKICTLGAVALLVISISPGCSGDRDPPAIQWRRPIPFSAVSMKAMGDGEYAICGNLETQAGRSAIVIKIDSSGEESWRSVIDIPEGSFSFDMDISPDEGFLVAGGTGKWGQDESDVLLLNIDSSGKLLWSKTFGGPGFDWGTSVRKTADGGMIVGGVTWSFGAGSQIYLLKVDRTGKLEWERDIGAEGHEGQHESGARAIQTKDGAFVVVGSTTSKSLGVNGGNQVAVYLVKLDARGNKLWERTYGAKNGFDIGESILELDDGSFIIGGIRELHNAGLYLLKTDSRGNLAWEKNYDAVFAQGYAPLVHSNTGGFVFGNRIFVSDKSTDALLIGADSSGEAQWRWTFGGENHERITDLIETSDNDLLVLGYELDKGSFLIKLSQK